jgi:hypothetical protein
MVALTGFNVKLASTPPEVVSILLDAGQSNDLGRNQAAGWDDFPAPYKVFIPNAFINYAYDTPPNNQTFQALDGSVDSVSKRYRYVGTQYSIAKQYTEFTGKSLYIVHYAVGTTSLQSDWNPAGAGVLYANFVQYAINAVNNIIAMGKIPRIISIKWVQGEQDANVGVTAGQYKTLLTSFFNSLRNNATLLPYYVGGANVNIQLAQLGTWASTQNQSYAANRLRVRADQIAFASEATNVQLIETEDLPSIVGDDIHRTTGAQFTIGKRVADNIQGIT